MVEFNIENYRDYESITIAQYVAAKSKVKNIAIESANNGDLKTAREFSKIYFQLNYFLGKKIKLGSGLGYKPRGKSK